MKPAADSLGPAGSTPGPEAGPPGLRVDSLERIVPRLMDPEDRAGAETLEIHLERYRFAADHARPGRLLDLACGVGYGTRLMADRQPAIESALGVDLSPAAVDYARAQYADERVRYEQGDGMRFSDDEGFDTVVSLETVEHVPDAEAFFGRLAGLLAPSGVLIASVPVTPSVDLNPHHLSDFTRRGFRRMGERSGLAERAALEQVQRHDPLELFRGKRFKHDNLRPNLIGYYLAHPGAAIRRLSSTLRCGFASHYLTLVWQRRA